VAEGKTIIDEQRGIKEQLDSFGLNIEARARRGELSKASEIQYGKIPELERKLAELTEKTRKLTLLREE